METELPKTNNLGIEHLWQQIEPYLKSLSEHRQKVIELSPPTPGRISEFLATTKDEYVVDGLAQIRHYNQLIENVKKALDEYAYEKLNNPANNDERLAARQRFNSTKNKVVMMVNALAAVAAHEGEHEIVDFCTSLLDNLPKLSNPNKASNTDTKKAREWLQTNHPELNIGARGKISEEHLTLYYNRDK